MLSELGDDMAQVPVSKAAYRAMITVSQSALPAEALNILWGPSETSGKIGRCFSLGPKPSAQEEWLMSSQALASLSPRTCLAIEAPQRFALVADDMHVQAVHFESAAAFELYRAGNCIICLEHITDRLPAQFVQQEGQEGAQQHLRAMSATRAMHCPP